MEEHKVSPKDIETNYSAEGFTSKDSPQLNGEPVMFDRSNFVPTSGGTIMKGGVSKSRNFVKGESGWQLDASGNLEANDGVFRGNLVVGNLWKTIGPTNDIQEAIDEISAGGGGTLYLKSGVYTPSAAITVPSFIEIVGVNAGSTIINFGSTSANFVVAGSSAYSTGTVTSIASNFIVTGSGTSWLSNVTTAHDFYIANRWYRIASVDSDTQITLLEPYLGGATFPGAAYRTAIVNNGCYFRKMTVTGSTGTGIELTDAKNLEFEDVFVVQCNKGLVFTHTSLVQIDDLQGNLNTSNGIEFNTSGFCDFEALIAGGNGGHGIVFNDFRIAGMFTSSVTGNTGDGINATSVSSLTMTAVEFIANGGQGMELVATSGDLNIIGCDFQGNTGDNLKLTATTDNVRITSNFFYASGGYGTNIAASTCDNNVITGNTYSLNTTDAVNDGGTGTVIRGNVGVNDNATGSNAAATFGGDGSDGALAISSGTTTIDLSNVSYVVKNYTSISITGTGKLAFSNPNTNGSIVILKSQKAVTLTSSTATMIDCSALGATTATTGFTTIDVLTDKGVVGSDRDIGGLDGGNGGNGGAGFSAFDEFFNLGLETKNIKVACGGGGAAGGAADGGAGGAGGKGGGGLYIESRGAFNFTTSAGISVAGAVGSVGASDSDTDDGGAGGGGGGGGGTCIILYNELTANTGTITIAGGTGGAGGNGNSGGSQAGGAGGAGGNGVAGSSNGGNGGKGGNSTTSTAGGGGGGGGGGATLHGGSNGSNGAATSNGTGGRGGGGGGGGASGYSLVQANKFFV